jgi:hypothetical protein
MGISQGADREAKQKQAGNDPSRKIPDNPEAAPKNSPAPRAFLALKHTSRVYIQFAHIKQRLRFDFGGCLGMVKG